MTTPTIKEAVQPIQELDFGEDTCSINCCMEKECKTMRFFKIINMERPDISSAVYGLLHSQPTTASAEKSFSTLGKLLAKDRNF